MLSVRNVTTQLDGFRLDNVSFDVGNGDYFVLLGPSGAGKSVLVEVLAGITGVRGGAILLDGKDVTHARPQHRGMATLFQEPSLFPHLTVARNIGYGLHGTRMSRRDFHERVHDLAKDVGVSHLLSRYPGTLSGGEVQRVALARCLAVSPGCLLLDEPLVALDSAARVAMRALLRDVKRMGLTVVHVTHDFEEAVSLASHVGILEGGRLVQAGTSREVFRCPKTPFAAQFIGFRNCFAGYLLQGPTGGVAEFDAGGCVFRVATSSPTSRGYVVLRVRDVTVTRALLAVNGYNVLEGTVTDVIPAPFGDEVVADIGVEITATAPRGDTASPGIERGERVWVSFEPDDAVFIKDSNAFSTPDVAGGLHGSERRQD